MSRWTLGAHGGRRIASGLHSSLNSLQFASDKVAEALSTSVVNL